MQVLLVETGALRGNMFNRDGGRFDEMFPRGIPFDFPRAGTSDL